MAKAMTLIRRCLMLVILYSVATVSVAQMPSPQLDVVFVPAVQEEVILQSFPTEDIPVPTLVSGISERFKIPVKMATRIVNLAEEYADEVFPTKADILAIIDIESSFNKDARYRDCFGLMMIQKKSHKEKLGRRDVMNPSANIEVGSLILKEHFLALGSNRKSAILSFNAGIGNFLKNRYNEKYYTKYRKALAKYSVN